MVVVTLDTSRRPSSVGSAANEKKRTTSIKDTKNIEQILKDALNEVEGRLFSKVIKKTFVPSHNL